MMEEALVRLTDALSGTPGAGAREQLIPLVRELINHDFNALVTLLYRVDVSEQKLRQQLQENPDADAAVLITDLIMERQYRKQQTRQQNPSPKDDTGEERW